MGTDDKTFPDASGPAKRLSVDDVKGFFASLRQQFDMAPDEANCEPFRWVAENFSNMDEEAQDFIGGWQDRVMEVFAALYENAPDSPTRRQALRLRSRRLGKFPDAKLLVKTLDAPSQRASELDADGERIALLGVQMLGDFLHDFRSNQVRTRPEIACVTLLYNCFDELVVAVHLALHGYYLQAGSHCRSVIEATDLVELFMLEPKWLDDWVKHDDAWSKLSPGKVRKKLKQKGKNPQYTFFSEFSTHQTFRGFQSRAHHDLLDDGGIGYRIHVGGTRLEHLQVFFWTSALLVVAGAVHTVISLCRSEINEEEATSRRTNFYVEFSGFIKERVVPWAKGTGMNTSEWTALLEMLDAELSGLNRDDHCPPGVGS